MPERHFLPSFERCQRRVTWCNFMNGQWRKRSCQCLVSSAGGSCICQSLSSFPTVHWPWVPGIDFLWCRAEGSLLRGPLPCGVIGNRFLKSRCNGDGSPASEDHQSSHSVTRVTSALNLSSYKPQTWQRRATHWRKLRRSWKQTHSVTRTATLAGRRINVSPPLTHPWQPLSPTYRTLTIRRRIKFRLLLWQDDVWVSTYSCSAPYNRPHSSSITYKCPPSHTLTLGGWPHGFRPNHTSSFNMTGYLAASALSKQVSGTQLMGVPGRLLKHMYSTCEASSPPGQCMWS